MIELALTGARVVAVFAAGLLLAASLRNIVTAAARDVSLRNGNATSYAHLACQAIGVVVMLIALVALAACGAASSPPKTESSMLAWRLAHPDYLRACPVGSAIEPLDDPARDGCDDPYGLSWSSCAWNAEGRYMSTSELMSPARLGGSCGTDGFSDCGAR